MQNGILTSHLLTLTLAASTAALAAQGPAASAAQQPALQQVHIATGSLKGKILSTGSRSPMADHTLQVLDSKGVTLGKITTDAAGNYATPNLAAGNYTLEVQNGMRLGLIVDKAATIKTLDIVVPPVAAAPVAQNPTTPSPSPSPAPSPGGSAAGTAAAPSVAAAGAGGIGAGGIALIGAGAAAAVAVPIGLSGGGGGGGSEPVVSPAGEKARR